MRPTKVSTCSTRMVVRLAFSVVVATAIRPPARSSLLIVRDTYPVFAAGCRLPAMLVEDLARYAASERSSRLPEEVVHHAKRAALDRCAALLPGTSEPPATLLFEAFAE